MPAGTPVVLVPVDGYQQVAYQAVQTWNSVNGGGLLTTVQFALSIIMVLMGAALVASQFRQGE
jgi:hypothetical protein